jgi:hypothetical protein
VSDIKVIEVEGDVITIQVDEPDYIIVDVVDDEPITVIELVEKGDKGDPGTGGGGGGGNLVVSATDPGLTEPGLWIQTGLGAGGTDMTFWVEDGT